MYRRYAFGLGLVLSVTGTLEIQARVRASLQESPTSVTTITDAGLRHLANQDLRDLTGYTPGLRVGRTTANGATIQVRGTLTDPHFQIDGQRLNFGGENIDLDSAEGLRGPQGTLFGQTTLGSQTLSDTAQVYTRVLNAQQQTDQPYLDTLRSATRIDSFPTVEESGILRGLDEYELCSPQQVSALMQLFLLTERALGDAAINRFEATTGRNFALTMNDTELADGFENYRYNADVRFNGFRAQYDALSNYATEFFETDCEPFNQNMNWRHGWLDAALSSDLSLSASMGASGAGDIGSRRPEEFSTQIDGEVWAPDLSGVWQIRDGLSFSNTDLTNRLYGSYADRCQRYEGPSEDAREYAFASSIGAAYRIGENFDIRLPLYDQVPPDMPSATEPNLFQQSYANNLSIAQRRLCTDPQDYTTDLDFTFNLTQQVFSRASMLGYLDYLPAAENRLDTSRGDLRLSVGTDWNYRTTERGNQSGYDTEPDFRLRNDTFSTQINFDNFRISQSLPYRAPLSYTFPNLAPNDAFMPDCFEPQHYGTFSIGQNEYVRVFISPALLASIDMQGLEVVGVFIDPFRGPQTDPYMGPTAAGGGAWGQSFDNQWAIKKVGFTNNKLSAWSKLDNESTQPVVVAVIDTGLDWHHQDISPKNIWKNPGEIAGNGIDDDTNGYVDDVIGYDFMERDGKPWDQHGHGTMVSGIIAATRNNEIGIAGINPLAQVMVLRVTNDFGNTNASYIAEAIAYAVDNGASIINISMGGLGRSKLEQEAIAYAKERGVLVVAAAGNEGIELEDYGPGAEEGVFTVAATDLNDEAASFSNTGDAVDIAAPGVDVLSLRARATDVNLGASGDAYTLGDYYVGTDKRYIRASGTSFATPIVTGAASALLAIEPELSADDIKQRLTDTAWDLGKPGQDNKTGAGLLDARTALTVDKSFFITASVGRMIPNADSETLEIYGQADANQFKRAWLQIGEGSDPETWKYVGLKLKRPVRDSVLSEIPLKEFGNTGLWTVRINVEHKSGTVRRATKAIRLK